MDRTLVSLFLSFWEICSCSPGFGDDHRSRNLQSGSTHGTGLCGFDHEWARQSR